MKRPTKIGSTWKGPGYIHGPRRTSPQKYSEFRLKKLKSGKRLVLGRLKGTNKWEVQSTLRPRKRPGQHIRKLRTGRRILINKGIPRAKVSQPLQVKEYKKEEVIAEPKYDGTRMLLQIKDNKPLFINRRSVIKNETYPELLDIGNSIRGDVLLDGEIVAIDKSHKYGNFEKLARRDRLKDKDEIKKRSKKFPLKYVVFDILKKGPKSVEKLPLLERKKILDQVVKQGQDIKEIEYTNKPKGMIKKVKKANGEGVIIKAIDSEYKHGRNPEWQKIKFAKENDVAVLGFTPGTGKRKKYFGALQIGINGRKGFIPVGKVGTGFTEDDLKDITKRLKEGRKFVARVKYRKIGSQGNYIEPSFIGIREDISPEDTHW